MHWTKLLTKHEREHLKTDVVPNEGLHSKRVVVERLNQTLSHQHTLGANWVCVECSDILKKLENA